MATMKIIFDGFDQLTKEIEAAGKRIKPAVNEALEETQKIIQHETTSASSVYAHKGGGLKGYATGAMYRAILKNVHPEWAGTVATIKVGFNLRKKGGVHSIFVMYGTKKHAVKNQYGTPRKAGAKKTGITADKRIYDAIRGSAVQAKVAKEQEDVMRRYLALGGA